MTNGFLKVKNGKIVNSKGKAIILKGINLGGWLMMEGYILHSLNEAAQKFKRQFAKALGKNALREFEREFRNNFIRESDIKRIASYGFNCIRVPFNHRLIEKRPYEYDRNGVSYLDRVIRWARKYKLWIILDLHGAAGAQNHDWHSDSLGKALLWTTKSFQKRTFALWKFLANRYKNEETVVGYDLLNEAVLHDARKLNSFYKGVIKAIRSVDKNHILFIEGNNWATDIRCLDKFEDDNYALSVHFYYPLDFIFNFVPHLSYPLRYQNVLWNKKTLKKYMEVHRKVAKKHKTPILVGEFGVNNREGYYGEDKYLKDVFLSFKECGFHWTYWTYKAVANDSFPDGLFSYHENSPWVNRQGPLIGWNSYHLYWRTRKKDMIRSWHTEHFQESTEITRVLKKALK